MGPGAARGLGLSELTPPHGLARRKRLRRTARSIGGKAAEFKDPRDSIPGLAAGRRPAIACGVQPRGRSEWPPLCVGRQRVREFGEGGREREGEGGRGEGEEGGREGGKEEEEAVVVAVAVVHWWRRLKLALMGGGTVSVLAGTPWPGLGLWLLLVLIARSGIGVRARACAQLRLHVSERVDSARYHISHTYTSTHTLC